MQRLPSTFALIALAAAGSASAGTDPGYPDDCFHVTFTVELDDDAQAALQAAGLAAPSFQGSAVFDASTLTGVGFEFLDAGAGFNAFAFDITDRQAPGGGALPDLQFDLADDTNAFASPQAVFNDGEIQGFNFESVPNAPTFGPEDVAFGQGRVRLGSGIIPDEGEGDLVFTAPIHCDDATSVPTPTAFAAGLALLALNIRRRRRA